MALHILTLVLSAVLPSMLHHRPLLDEVVTVNLVSMPDSGPETQQPAAAPQAQQSAPPEPKPAPKPEPPPKVEPETPKIQVAEPPPVVKETPVPAKQISLKPIKKKVKLVDEEKLLQEKVEKIAEKKQTQEKAEQQRLKEIAKARQEEQNAVREAERARAALAEMIRARGAQNPGAGTAKGSSSAAGRQGVSSIVSQQYLMELGAHVQQFWILPEMRQWDPRLETVVVLTIRRDGTVAKTSVEQPSADPLFDQFVMKTIDSASPMPQFPKLMSEDSIEVGLRFRPNENVGMR